jgi:glycosyltransferase involved in cell wall biosynthesis
MALVGAPVRPRILFVTSHWPLAPAYGAQQRVLNIGRLLTRFGDLSFVVVPSEPEDDETARRTSAEFDVRRVIRPCLTAKHRFLRGLGERFRNEFDPTYMATDDYVVSDHDRKGLQELIQQQDLVWIHTIRTANWFRIFRWPASVLDVDDLLSRQLWSAAVADSSPLKRLLYLKRSWNWRRRERLLPERFDVLTVCSEDDRRYLGRRDQIHVIPNGFHPIVAPRSASSELLRIGLIGNCTFMPNEEGIKWFIRDVWAAIKRELPRAHLRLVGRGSDGYLTTLGPDITGLGWLEDPGNEIASWSAMIIPIKVGSGTRVKLAEGFARRCPVVSTSIGAFGYDVNNGEEILLADGADPFASACIRLLKDPHLGEALSERAYKRFLDRWTWDSFESTVGRAVQECLARSSRPHHS